MPVDGQTQLILDAIHTLRQDLSDRMDRMETQLREDSENQWAKINQLAICQCPQEQHDDMEQRVRCLETAAARVAGIVIATGILAGLIGWTIERIIG